MIEGLKERDEYPNAIMSVLSTCDGVSCCFASRKLFLWDSDTTAVSVSSLVFELNTPELSALSKVTEVFVSEGCLRRYMLLPWPVVQRFSESNGLDPQRLNT